MTQALCLYCGEVKFGALNPCTKCNHGSTGDMSTDILFSDHHMHPRTLEQLGEVIKTINLASTDEGLSSAAFMAYMSDNHPSVLQVRPEASFLPRAREFLSTLTLPEVEILPGRQGVPNLEKQLARADRKRWWQFWRRGQPP